MTKINKIELMIMEPPNHIIPCQTRIMEQN